MKAFHGTNNVFDCFDSSFLGLNTDDNATDEYFAMSAHLGFWFTDRTDKITEVYDKIMVCEIKLENPMIVENIESLAYWLRIQEKTSDEIREMIMDWGYDGILIENDEEFGGSSFVIFDADKITKL